MAPGLPGLLTLLVGRTSWLSTRVQGVALVYGTELGF